MFKDFPKVRRDEPLSKHCWYGLGGPADFFVEIENIDQLVPLICEANKGGIPFFVLGGGSNTVFHDDGFRGIVIKTVKCQNVLEMAEQSNDEFGVFMVDCGVLTTQFVKMVLDKGYTGIESLFGLPGTIGGAVFGNAEAHKTSIGDFVKSVMILTKDGVVEEKPDDYFDFEYRHSKLHETGEIVLKVTLKLPKSNSVDENQRKKAKEALEFRKNHQPSGKNNGSFFKNPEGDFAGRLIDVAGLKGLKVGGAFVSEKHANFFMNDGTAKTQDLIDLKAQVQANVMDEFGVKLVSEVRIVMPDGAYLNDIEA